MTVLLNALNFESGDVGVGGCYSLCPIHSFGRGEEGWLLVKRLFLWKPGSQISRDGWSSAIPFLCLVVVFPGLPGRCLVSGVELRFKVGLSQLIIGLGEMVSSVKIVPLIFVLGSGQKYLHQPRSVYSPTLLISLVVFRTRLLGKGLESVGTLKTPRLVEFQDSRPNRPLPWQNFRLRKTIHKIIFLACMFLVQIKLDPHWF